MTIMMTTSKRGKKKMICGCKRLGPEYTLSPISESTGSLNCICKEWNREICWNLTKSLFKCMRSSHSISISTSTSIKKETICTFKHRHLKHGPSNFLHSPRASISGNLPSSAVQPWPWRDTSHLLMISSKSIRSVSGCSSSGRKSFRRWFGVHWRRGTLS